MQQWPRAAWGKGQGAQDSSLWGGKISPSQKANTSMETLSQWGGMVETYLYNAEAALFSPLGLLGLGSPAMLISAMNGHAAVTRHVHAHRQLRPTTQQGRPCTALPSAETTSSTSPTAFPPAFSVSGAPLGLHRKENICSRLSSLFPFLYKATNHLFLKSTPRTQSNPRTQIQDRFLRRTRCCYDTARTIYKTAACCLLLTIYAFASSGIKMSAKQEPARHRRGLGCVKSRTGCRHTPAATPAELGGASSTTAGENELF